jgi:hypothetical protein
MASIVNAVAEKARPQSSRFVHVIQDIKLWGEELRRNGRDGREGKGETDLELGRCRQRWRIAGCVKGRAWHVERNRRWPVNARRRDRDGKVGNEGWDVFRGRGSVGSGVTGGQTE